MKRTGVALALAFLLSGGILLVVKLTASPPDALPTYFEYTAEELEALRDLRSKQQITPEDLYRWDELTFALVSKHTLFTGFDPNTSNVYATLLVAQSDAAFLSLKAKGRFAGSITPVSRGVLCHFFPPDCSSITPTDEVDAYSEALARIVLRRLRARIAQDERLARPHEPKVGPQYWSGPEPMIGIADGSRQTWLIASGKQFRAPPPPAHDSAAFKGQLAQVKAALAAISNAQRKAVISWAGGPGTRTPPGQWLKIADDHMRTRNVSLGRVLHVRSALAMAMADAIIAVFDSKYTYWVKRPFMMDRSIRTVMPTPNHPSYPAGHSTISAAAATILSEYFPEHAKTWWNLAREAGLSRVWGGIHYPIDHEQGLALGERVAREAIRRLLNAQAKN